MMMLSSGVCNPAIRVGGFGPMFDGKHLVSPAIRIHKRVLTRRCPPDELL